jgi:hypothetical protein
MSLVRTSGFRVNLRIVVVGMVLAVLGSTPSLWARSPVRQYSQSLRAEFYWDRFYFPNCGYQWAACAMEIDDNSPLRAIGMQSGDIITRLDDIVLTNLDSLDQHYCWTKVRYYRGEKNPYDQKKRRYTKEIHIRSSDCAH